MDEIRELDLKRVLNTLTSVNSARAQLETPASGLKGLQGPRGLDPPGNFYAAGIKNIQDDSRSVFPESVYSDVIARRKRWSSTYENHYVPRQEEEFDRWMDEYMSGVPATNKPTSAPNFIQGRAMNTPAAGRDKTTLQLTERDRASNV